MDNQWAFKYGAQQEFGMRDERCEEGEEVISRKTIEDSIDGENAEAYRIVLDGKNVGGVVLRIDKESAKGELELLFVLPEIHSKGNRPGSMESGGGYASGNQGLGDNYALLREAQHPLLREPLRFPHRGVLEQVPTWPCYSGGGRRKLEHG